MAAGCATGQVVDGIYRDAAQGYQVRLPAAPWIASPLDGAALSFRDPDLQAAMALQVNCTAPEAGELRWVARHLFFGLQDRQIQTQEGLRLHDVDSVRTRLLARLDGRPVEGEGVTLRRQGCLYDFMYVAPPAAFEQGQPDFEAFVESWAPLLGR